MAVIACNTGFQTYSFPTATTAIYNFWLYELCDFYLEFMKPIMNDASQTPEALAKKASMRDVLYTCLDVGLRMLHPFMPFLTEELYQRLPRRPSATHPSISLAEYPEEIASLNDAENEKNVDLILEVIKGIRSMRAALFKPKDQVIVHISPKNKLAAELIASEKINITTLCKADLHLLAEGAAAPANSELTTLNDQCDIFLIKP